MTMVSGGRLNVAILIFDDMQILDFAGPMDVLVTKSEELNVYTVGFQGVPVTTTGGLNVVPKYSFTSAPEADILIVPGGSIGKVARHEPTLDWVKVQVEQADHVLSVCTGSFILASAGFLTGLQSTTYHTALAQFAQKFPAIEVVNDQRWVDNGKFMSSAGISSGIDATLHLVEKLFGAAEATDVALDLEYNWDPAAHYVRALLPDLQIPDIDVGDNSVWEMVFNEGDQSGWHVGGYLTQDTNLDSLMAEVEKSLNGAEVSELKSQRQEDGFQFSYHTGEKGEWRQTVVVKQAKDQYFQVDINVVQAKN